MERRLLRIRRWIDRSIEAWRRGRPKEVIMELECAEAEMRIAKDEIFTHVSSDSKIGRRRGALEQVLISLLAAAVFLMALALPTSRESFVQYQEGQNLSTKREANSLHLSLITDDEERLIVALRKSLSDTNMARVYDVGDVKVASSQLEKVAAVAEKDEQKISSTSSKSGEIKRIIEAKENAPKELPEKKDHDVSFEEEMLEELFKLVRLGEKALRDQRGIDVELSD